MLRLAPISAETTADKKVIVVYENPLAREYAADVCAQFVGMPAESDKLRWIDCRAVEFQPWTSGMDDAKNADVIVFAMTSEGDFTPGLKLWIDRWLAKRNENEGTLAGIFCDTGATAPLIMSRKEIYLRHVAHRAGMDYLSHLPQRFRRTRAIPESLDDFNARARQMTSVLDEILHTHIRPSGPL
jgi:hypothetical protein